MPVGRAQYETMKFDMSERTRMSALMVGIIGLCVAAFLHVLYHVNDKDTMLVGIVMSSYAVILGIITLSAYRRFHVRTIFHNGCLALFAVFWTKTFVDGGLGHFKPLDIPVILLVPVFFAMSLGRKRLLLLAPVQFLFVFLYLDMYAAQVFLNEWSGREQFAFSFVIAALSAYSICLLAIVAFSREHADQKLFDIVAEAEELAATDGLTGLMNRRAFMDKLRAVWPSRKQIRIAFIDLDHFKPLNDQYGHAVGDQVLKHVATCISNVPEVEIAARLGGDEFAILLDGAIDPEDVEGVIEVLHAAVTSDIQWESGMISLAASIGYAEGETLKQTLSGVIRAADTAMRRAKTSKLGWARFNPMVDNAAIATSTLEVELKAAIKDGQIRAAVQPIADAKTRDVVAYELLTRWVGSSFPRDPSPKDFIPIAEKLGVLNDILWVTLNEALANLDLSSRRLAINVSPAQLLASDFLETLQGILASHSVDPRAITIEITEEVAFRNVDRNVAVLSQAREMGMAIALDDFGTGYSSLSMLDTLPLDKLKIDQSFVRKSDKSTQSKSILLAAIRLARQLGLESCVEGIETERNARRIAALGADTIQGYWLGRPELVRDRVQALKMVS